MGAAHDLCEQRRIGLAVNIAVDFAAEAVIDEFADHPFGAKTRVQPTYPELAHKMNISGTVKIEVTVAPNGTIKEARVVGGHPVLAQSALDAAKRWRFEPAASESTGVIDFKFESR